MDGALKVDLRMQEKCSVPFGGGIILCLTFQNVNTRDPSILCFTYSIPSLLLDNLKRCIDPSPPTNNLSCPL